ncbi:helix-turn-helix transcriptional regulator [Maricaulis sp.]|uniref:helix-turn-helix domain-containing protein n=1 Tax=Maricaulis sp. TaxID=1486257 RepID=UPI000C3FCFEA|nr:helix-turn-helix transcriptional regulator [Maricaulis sp.]MAC89388.1 transcriptional regulator [Maricaulis sp.]
MPKAVFSDAYKVILFHLIQERKQAGITQQELANRLNRPQPFISQIENGVRRIDVLEFYAIAKAIGTDPAKLFNQIVRELPDDIEV